MKTSKEAARILPTLPNQSPAMRKYISAFVEHVRIGDSDLFVQGAWEARHERMSALWFKLTPAERAAIDAALDIKR